MRALDIPAVQEAEQKVLAGIPPNFQDVHICTVCGSEYYCPDRYISERCESTAYIRKMGWVNDNKFGCLPCMAELSDEERARWYSIHGVKDQHSTEK